MNEPVSLCENYLRSLKQKGCRIDPGLSDAEMSKIQVRFDIRFPADLRLFLSLGLPSDQRFVDWRHAGDQAIQDRLDGPLAGIQFDIQHNSFWLNSWGERPASLEAALQAAARHVQAAPKMIPIFAHRYMPDRPGQAGNPVFSIHQTDIICFGHDLWDYLSNEFQLPRLALRPSEPRQIEFWSQFL